MRKFSITRLITVVFIFSIILSCSRQAEEPPTPADSLAAPTQQAPDLAAWLSLDGSFEAHGDSIVARAYGSLGWTADRRDSAGCALRLRGGWAVLDSFPRPDSLASFTLTAWVDGSDGVILATEDYSLYCVHRRLAWGVPGSEDERVQARSPLLPGEWRFVAGVYDADTGSMRLFINGMLEAERYTPLRLEGGRGEATLGRGDMPGRLQPSSFTGRLDDIRLWRSAKSESELQEMYTAP
ncbi:MAG: LamG domain-containing protein [Candidatus Cloacimonetes bacterium]|nr:LamG domain-containing protein [Candidatus Cloacimonadota bacterium]